MNLDELREEIASDEGKIQRSYLCSENHLTVGIGHLCLEGEPEYDLPLGTEVSESRVNALFEMDIHQTIGDCRDIYKNFDEKPEDLQKILANMCFQLGKTRLKKFVQTNALIESADYQAAAIEMLDSRWSEQTPNRAQRLSSRMAALS